MDIERLHNLSYARHEVHTFGAFYAAKLRAVISV